MKKLKLNIQNKEMLTKAQMREINGGSGNCYAFCCSGGPGTCGPGTFVHSGCTTNEICQADALAAGAYCEKSGDYVAGLCM